MFFGEYPQQSANSAGKQPIEWIVLEEQEDKIFLLSKYILDVQPYCRAEYNSYSSWDASTVREWLHTTFKSEAFSDEEQDRIIATKPRKCTMCMEWRYDVKRLPCYTSNYRACKDMGKTRDELFLLSTKEIKRYTEESDTLWSVIFLAEGTPYAFSQGLESTVNDWEWELDEEDAGLGFNEKDGPWFLRTFGKLNPYSVGFDVIAEDCDEADTRVGIRPALWMKK